MEHRNSQEDSKNGNAKRPLSLKDLAIIVVAGHLGVRKRVHRVSDFERANGFHVFLAATFYFAVLVTGLVFLVIHIAS